MFRDNEASRVSAVLERKLAGDHLGMIDAAVELWLAEPEQPGPDGAEDEVWRAIVEVDECKAATTAGMRLVRDRQRMRPSAFIDIAEAIDDPATRVELAELVADSDWDVHPYLAASFIRLVEHGQEDALWQLIGKRRDKLTSTTAHWLLVAVILTTTRIGDRKDLASWFTSCTSRDRVPMWILAIYCATLHRHAADGELVETATSALDLAERDATIGYFASVLAIDDLRHERYDAFRRRIADHRAAIEACAAATPLSHPLVDYLQATKHTHRVSAADVTFKRPELVVQRGTVTTLSGDLVEVLGRQLRHEPLRPTNWRVGELLNEITDRAGRAKTIVIDGFARLVDLSTGDPEIDRLARMIVEAECDLPGVQDAVNHVVRGLRRGRLV